MRAGNDFKAVTDIRRVTVCYGPVTDLCNTPKSLKTKVFIIYICLVLQINKYISTHTHTPTHTHTRTHTHRDTLIRKKP
jgi:hypothetical protein